MRNGHRRPWHLPKPVTTSVLALGFVVAAASATPLAPAATAPARMTVPAAMTGGYFVVPKAGAPAVPYKSVAWSTQVPSVRSAVTTPARRARTVCRSGARPTTIRSRQVWSPGYASAYLVGCTVVISRGAQLALAPGTVVELGGSDIYVAPGGSLLASGTAARPVVFTSLPGAGYNQVVTMDGHASVRISHAVFRLGSSGMGAAAITTGDPMLISGCAARGGDTLVVKASVLVGPINLGQCDSRTAGSRFWLSSDRFDAGADFSLSGNPLDSVHLTGNSFSSNPQAQPTTAIYMNSLPVQGVDLTGPGANTFSSPGQPLTVSLQNAVVPSGTSWTLSSPDGAVLTGQVAVDGSATITRGAVLDNAAFTVGLHGSMQAQGTAKQPVRFTAGSSVQVTGGGSLRVDHVVFSGLGGPNGENVYEGSCTGDGDESVSIQGSTFEGAVSLGACDTNGREDLVINDNLFRPLDSVMALGLSVPGAAGPENPHPGHLVVSGNVFDPSPGPRSSTPVPQLSVYGWPVQGLALSGDRANRFEGGGASRVVDLSDCQVPAGISWTVAPGGGEVLEAQTDYFDHAGIIVTGHLDLLAGSIVKVGVTRALGGGIGVGFGIALGNQGALDVDGTAAHPVTFTSMADDSVGGESSGARTTPSQHDYEIAVSAEEGSRVDVTHAAFRDGWYAFQAGCGPAPRDGGSFVLTASTVDDEVSLGDCDGSQHGYVPVLRANTFDFDGAASGNFAAGGGYDPSALQPALLLFNLDPTGVNLSGNNSNHFQGKGAGRVVAVAGVTVPKGETWTVSAASGAVLAPWPDTDYLTPPGITVNGTLDLQPGVDVKSAIGGVGIDVQSLGDLQAAGSSTTPDVFTAISDDSVAGDSNGDGNASAPKPGAYGIAVQFENIDNGSALDHDVFAFASDAINVQLLDRFTVTDSDFVDNIDAFDVEGSTSNDPVLASLPCVPPYLSSSASEGDWYGPHGFPAPNIDLGAFAGVAVPPIFSSVFNYLTTEVDESLNLFGGPNTIPWTIYSCPPALIPPFPITPIDVFDIPPGPNFAHVDPAYAPLS